MGEVRMANASRIARLEEAEKLALALYSCVKGLEAELPELEASAPERWGAVAEALRAAIDVEQLGSIAYLIAALQRVHVHP